ncbi:MAG: hypothetical protein M3017_14065, partial [Actinomycetota bacterium]|nr:hypothetical protein [Actinomycetota bacterium]
MPEQPIHRLPEEFGGNEWLVDELYERYQQDRKSVDAKWWPLFESFDADSNGSPNGRHTATDANPVTRELPIVQAPSQAATGTAGQAPAKPAAAVPAKPAPAKPAAAAPAKPAAAA